MSSINYRVSLGFTGLPDAELDEFTGNVVLCLTGNAAYPDLPVTLAKITALQTPFRNALQAATQGGTQLTAVKNAARDALDSALRKQAAYVQIVASDDLPTLLSSGFETANANRSSSQLYAPNIVAVFNAATKQLVLNLQPVANARAYEIQIASAPGQWQHALTSTKSRSVVLNNLTPGTNYGIQVRAVGGSTGYSNWSEPVSHMAT